MGCLALLSLRLETSITLTRLDIRILGAQGDELSIQNAIMVTRSSRYALMVDPQGLDTSEVA